MTRPRISEMKADYGAVLCANCNRVHAVEFAYGGRWYYCPNVGWLSAELFERSAPNQTPASIQATADNSARARARMQNCPNETTKWRYEIIVDLAEEDDPHALFRLFEALLTLSHPYPNHKLTFYRI